MFVSEPTVGDGEASCAPSGSAISTVLPSPEQRSRQAQTLQAAAPHSPEAGPLPRPPHARLPPPQPAPSAPPPAARALPAWLCPTLRRQEMGEFSRQRHPTSEGGKGGLRGAAVLQGALLGGRWRQGRGQVRGRSPVLDHWTGAGSSCHLSQALSVSLSSSAEALALLVTGPSVRLRARGHRSRQVCAPIPPLRPFSNLFAMFLSLHLCFCALPFPSCLSLPTGLRNGQAKVTEPHRGWLTAQTHVPEVTPLCSAVLRPCWDHGGSSRAPFCRKGLHVGWEAGRGSAARGAGCWGGADCLHLPYTQPTLASHARALPRPGTPLQKAAREQGARSSAHRLLSQGLV